MITTSIALSIEVTPNTIFIYLTMWWALDSWVSRYCPGLSTHVFSGHLNSVQNRTHHWKDLTLVYVIRARHSWKRSCWCTLIRCSWRNGCSKFRFLTLSPLWMILAVKAALLHVASFLFTNKGLLGDLTFYVMMYLNYKPLYSSCWFRSMVYPFLEPYSIVASLRPR